MGKEWRKKKEIDNAMIKADGTENKSKFGANAILSVSMAVCRSGAAAKKISLYKHISEISGNKELVMPVPSFNVINGGAHGALNSQGKPYNPIQEIMLVPVSSSFEQGYERVMQVFQKLKKVSHETLVGKEGGISPAKSLQE